VSPRQHSDSSQSPAAVQRQTSDHTFCYRLHVLRKRSRVVDMPLNLSELNPVGINSEEKNNENYQPTGNHFKLV